MARVFISYSHADQAFARKIASDLEILGARVWIDEGELAIGDSLIAAITHAIDSVDFLAVLISSSSVTSRWVQEELNMALVDQLDGRHIKVLPLLLENCKLPGFLRSRVYADFRTADAYEDAFLKLAESVGLEPIHPWVRSRLERFAGRAQIARVRDKLRLQGKPCPRCGEALTTRITGLDDCFILDVLCRENGDSLGLREIVFYS